MIEIEHLTYRYPNAPAPVLADVSLRIARGAFVLVVGPSGAGKSTLLRCLNGLVPHFYGGTIEGRLRVAGADPVALEPRRMSQIVGFVFQDPEAQAVVDVVEDELAFAMENRGLPPETMRARVEEALARLDIAALRHRPLSTLSGGERQRVAIASALTLRPQVLVLDEPTSQLDPQAAGEVLDALVRLNRELGLTVILSEHRLERVARHADQVLYLPGEGRTPILGAPRAVLGEVPLVPPLIELGRRLGWSPLPLTIEEARPFAREAAGKKPAVQMAVGANLASDGRPPGQAYHPGTGQDLPLPQVGTASKKPALQEENALAAGTVAANSYSRNPAEASTPASDIAIEARDLRFAYNGTEVLHGIDLTVRRGEFLAIVGRNGAGKTTLLKQCIALLKPDGGQVCVLGQDTRQTPVERLARRAGYVPQNPNALLFADTIGGELAFTRRAQGLADDADNAGDAEGTDEALLRTLGLADMRARYPRDLSVGERQRVALAAVLVGDPELILLDEPTRGLDYAQKEALTGFLQAQKARGVTVVVVTHDVELVAQCAERVVVLDEGQVALDAPAREVMSRSPVFASQVGRLFGDPRCVTVDDVLGPGKHTADRTAPPLADADIGPAARPAGDAPHAKRSRTTPLNVAILALVSAIGVAQFLYPFLQPRAATGLGPGGTAHAQDAPLMFIVLVVLSLGAVLGNLLSGGGLNAKTVAVLGVLTAANAVLRVVPGPVGFSAMFALPILAGYAYGPTFGYLLGALSVAVSALLGAGIGPWMPYQMFALGWVGLSAAWLPDLRRRHPRIEIVLLAAWGALWGVAFGFVMNLWFWPYVYDATQAGIYWQPGTGALETFKRYLAFYALTSSWWDAGRAAGNALMIALFGIPVLRLLRRFGVRFTFEGREARW